MIVRRVVYRLLFPATVALPLWLLLGRGILAGDFWAIAGLMLIVAPLLFLALAAIGGILFWRPGVRTDRAVSLPDAVALPVLWLLLIAVAVVDSAPLVVLTVVAVLAMFWFAVWELVSEGRRRLRSAMADADAARNAARTGTPQRPAPIDIGEVIVVSSEDVSER